MLTPARWAFLNEINFKIKPTVTRTSSSSARVFRCISDSAAIARKFVKYSSFVAFSWIIRSCFSTNTLGTIKQFDSLEEQIFRFCEKKEREISSEKLRSLIKQTDDDAESRGKNLNLTLTSSSSSWMCRGEERKLCNPRLCDWLLTHL